MSINPVHDLKFSTHAAAAAAGQTDVVGEKGVDCSGFEGVVFLVVMGPITTGAVTTARAETSSDDGDQDAYKGSTGATVAIPDSADGSIVLVNVARPAERFVRCVVERTVEDSAVESILAVRYGPGVSPVVLDSSVAANVSVADAVPLT